MIKDNIFISRPSKAVKAAKARSGTNFHHSPFDKVIELLDISTWDRIPSYRTSPWVTKDITEPT